MTEERLAEFLLAERPRAYCDECLAVKLNARGDSAAVVALRLSKTSGFGRRVRLCNRCWRTKELTEPLS